MGAGAPRCKLCFYEPARRVLCTVMRRGRTGTLRRFCGLLCISSISPRAMRDSDAEQKGPGVHISPCHSTWWEDGSRRRPETICLVAACEMAAMERPSMFFSVFLRVREKNHLSIQGLIYLS